MPSDRADREPYLAPQESVARASAEADRKEERFRHYAESHDWKRLDEAPVRLGAEQSRAKRYLRAVFIVCLGMFSAACAAIVLVSVLQTGRNGMHSNATPLKPSSGKTVLPRGISASELPYGGHRQTFPNADVAPPPMPGQNGGSASLGKADTSAEGTAAPKSRAARSREGKETQVSMPTTEARSVAIREKAADKPRKRSSQEKKRQEFERLQQQAADEMLRNLQMAGH